MSGQQVSVGRVVGDVQDRSPILVDDMLSTGGTIEAAINALRAAGCRPEAMAVVTHGLFVGSADELLLPLELQRIFTTDSVMQRRNRLPVEVCSLGPLIAETIRRLHTDESLHDLSAAVRARSLPSPH